MAGTYDPWLVVLSVAVAIFASYVALDLAARVSASHGTRVGRWWLIGGALSMGMGIWSMHFIGMLAHRLPIPMAYDVPVTFVSLALAVASSGFALHVVSSGGLGAARLAGAGTLMGLGIAAMHYAGMAAMEIAPPIRYGGGLFTLSIVIAVAASIAALWIAFRLRAEGTLSAIWKKAGSAVVMGAAIAGMHYTGMAAAHFAPNSVSLVDPGNISSDWLAATIAVFTFLFLATTLLVSVFDARLAHSERRYRALWEVSSDAVVLLSDAGRVEFANPAVREIFGHEPAALTGSDIEVLQPPRLREAHRAGFERHLRTGERTVNWRSVETWGLHAEGHEFPVEIAFSRLEFDGGIGFAGFIKDITARKRFENLVTGQKQVLEVIASNATLPDALHAVTRMVEERAPGWRCSILLLDADGERVTVAAAASLPAEYNAAIEGQRIGPAAGSCGTAAYRRERVVSEDIATDPLWVSYRDTALRHGLRACWAQPILSQAGGVLGTFAMYYHEPRKPAPHDIDLITTAGTLAAIAIERKRADEQVRRLNRVHAMLSGINALIVRSYDRKELFEEACRIAANQGGFGVVVIEEWSSETSTMTPVAWAGADAGRYMELVTTVAVPLAEITLADALRDRKPVFVNDIGAMLASRGGNLRRKSAHALGYRSGIALPLIVNDALAGRMRLYAREANFFNDEEVKLLDELAGDISFALDHIAKDEKLDYLAYYDALTGMPNRALFHENLGQQLHIAAQQKVKLALFVADVKRFRLINESLGRQQGDALLKALAARLREMWPHPDNVARTSADHFSGILFKVNEISEIATVLDRLSSEVINPPFSIEGSELSIAMTVGIAVFPDDGANAEQLSNNAEAALKQAKARGERYLFYQPAMNEAVAETLLLESKLRRALERDEFVLHYQPKISLASGRVSGLEALIRWRDPETGSLVPPGRFIPLLEETGMINEIGLWALRRALADCHAWSLAGLRPPRVAVNVSAVQLARPDFVELVRRVIEEAPGGAGALDIEITESLLMQDIEGTIAKLRALRYMGVNISIDDFGTGYSSLGYLSRLPVNALKIDRSFIVTMGADSDSMTIVSTIISLAHSLSLQVIAEGVDSEPQRRVLTSLGCDEIQGYLVSHPVPPDEVARLLREDAARTLDAVPRAATAYTRS